MTHDPVNLRGEKGEVTHPCTEASRVRRRRRGRGGDTRTQVRNWLMPINRKHKLEKLLEVLKEEFPQGVEGKKERRHIFFEYMYASALRLHGNPPEMLAGMVYGVSSNTTLNRNPQERCMGTTQKLH